MIWHSPSACCEYVLLPLVNKEDALAYVRAEYSKVGNTSRDKRRKEVSEIPCSCQRRKTPEPYHGLVVIHRLIEMG